jgi:hypothetical protein
LEEAVGVAVVQGGIIVILKIIMRLRHVREVVVVGELGTVPVVQVVIPSEERLHRELMVIMGVARGVHV